MGLELKQLVQVDISGDYLWSTDYTKAYDVANNPTGWGAPNLELSESALLVVAQRVSNLQQLEVVGSQIKYSASALNSLQNQWQFVYPSKDGWIRFWLMRVWVTEDAIVDVSGDHLIAEGDFFFIPSVNNKIFEKTGSGSSAYEEVTDLIALTESTDVQNPYIIKCEDIFFNKIAKFKNNLYKDYQKARVKSDCSDSDEIMGKMNTIGHDAQGADYAFRSGLMNQANDIVETIIDDYQIV